MVSTKSVTGYENNNSGLLNDLTSLISSNQPIENIIRQLGTYPVSQILSNSALQEVAKKQNTQLIDFCLGIGLGNNPNYRNAATALYRFARTDYPETADYLLNSNLVSQALKNGLRTIGQEGRIGQETPILSGPGLRGPGSVRRNLFGAERQSTERLAELVQENRHDEERRRQILLNNYGSIVITDSTDGTNIGKTFSEII